MNEPWAVYIDVQGFKAQWHNPIDTMAAFRGLNALMVAVCRIGMKVYPNELFLCYQFGDAILMTSDRHERDLSRAVLITIAILRHMLSVDRFARASLIEGHAGDVMGCYPKEVLDLRDDKDPLTVHIGRGRLTISPVLGDALVNAESLAKKGPSGPLFLADSSLRSQLPSDVYAPDTEGGAISLNWLKGEPRGLRALQKRANLAIEAEEARVSRASRYIESATTLPEKWKASVFSYLLALSVTPEARAGRPMQSPNHLES